MVKHGILHVHTMYSLNDSTQTPDELMKRARELGCRNITLTDHGTLLGVDSFMEAGIKYGINAIPGLEAYLDENREHLILISRDLEGFRAISHADKEANKKQIKIGKRMKFPIMEMETVKKYLSGNHHVIATSACIQGPIARILLKNYYLDQKKDKLNAKLELLKEEYDEWTKSRLDYEKYVLLIKEEQGKVKKIRKYTKQDFYERIKRKRKKYEENKNAANAAKIKEEIDYETELYQKYTPICIESDHKIKEYKKLRKEYKSIVDKKKTKAAKYLEILEEIQNIQLVPEDILYREALKKARELASIFPYFFLELQYHGLEMERIVMPELVKISEETGIPVIAANDAHMSAGTEKNIKARQIVRYNYFDKHQEVEESDRTLYVKSDEELSDALLKILPEKVVKEALENTKILEECKVVFPKEEHYPKVKSTESFEELLNKEREKRIKLGVWDNRYEERLKKEVDTILEMGYRDYHMVVRDYCNMMRKMGCIPKSELKNIPEDFTELDRWLEEKNFKSGIGVGPGRGSAAGSLVCYMLGITNIDPIKYNLLFDRYLNVERVTLPDIDTDVKTSLRPYIIRYLKWKYGENAICSIMTETTYAAKGAIQMAGRDRASELYGCLPKKLQEGKIRDYMHTYTLPVSDIIPVEPGACISENEEKFRTAFQITKDTGQLTDENRERVTIWEHAKLLEGKLSSTSVHAGGVVISDNHDINDYVPLSLNEDDKKGWVWAAQCDMNHIEQKGMLKMDLLGLATLDCISDCLQLIEKHHGIVIDLDHIPFEPEVFEEIYANGFTNSVFQFESAGMKDMLLKFRPTCFEDLILLVAAYRPGPKKYLENIIDVKHKRCPLTYKTPMMEEILAPTYGATIYQEQVMQIFQKLAGYSLGGADLVRRAMSKKKEEKLKIEKPAFIYGDESRGIKGCVANGITERCAVEIFDDMIDFAKYAFNKSHAAAYAVLSYQTAWLKYHYPVEFECSMFNNKENTEYAPILEDCRKLNIQILQPDINRSYYDFTIEDGKIRYGLHGIKGVSNADSIQVVIDARESDEIKPYTSYTDFLKRMELKSEITQKKAMEAFIKSGVFDSLCKNREELFERYMKYNDQKFETVQVRDAYLNGMMDFVESEKDEAYNWKYEMEYLGTVVSDDPLKKYKSDFSYGCIPYDQLQEDEHVSVMGFVASVEKKVNKKGKQYLKLMLTGKAGALAVMLFHSAYENYAENIQKYENKVVKVTGTSKTTCVFADTIRYLSSYEQQYYLDCDTQERTEEVKKIILEYFREDNIDMETLQERKNGTFPVLVQFRYGKNGQKLQYFVVKRYYMKYQLIKQLNAKKMTQI